MSASAENVEMFISVTGGSKEQAQQYLQAASGDVQQAILTFFEAGGGDSEVAAAVAGAAAAAPAAARRSAPAPAPGASPIDSIVGLAKEGGDVMGKGTGKKGAGKGKDDDDGPSRKIGIVFFAEGFMVDLEGGLDGDSEEEEETPSAPAAYKPPTRGIRMMSLDDLPKDSQGSRPPLPKKLPKLSPLRPYDTVENKKFLDDVKAGLLPKELQQQDEKGKPVPTTIGISDERPESYAKLSEALDQMKKMKDAEDAEQQRTAAPAAPAMFTGAGQTCGGAVAAKPATGSGACDPALLALTMAGPVPVVDESKPATTLQLRLSTGARVKARLNLDHTIADLWRIVAQELGPVFATSSGHELCAGFPPKPLSDNSATLAAADLANASVTHRCR